MVYRCESCGFLFQRMGEVGECPSCEGRRICPAAPEEAERLYLQLKCQNTGYPESASMISGKNTKQF